MGTRPGRACDSVGLLVSCHRRFCLHLPDHPNGVVATVLVVATAMVLGAVVMVTVYGCNGDGGGCDS